MSVPLFKGCNFEDLGYLMALYLPLTLVWFFAEPFDNSNVLLAVTSLAHTISQFPFFQICRVCETSALDLSNYKRFIGTFSVACAVGRFGYIYHLYHYQSDLERFKLVYSVVNEFIRLCEVGIALSASFRVFNDFWFELYFGPLPVVLVSAMCFWSKAEYTVPFLYAVYSFLAYRILFLMRVDKQFKDLNNCSLTMIILFLGAKLTKHLLVFLTTGSNPGEFAYGIYLCLFVECSVALWLYFIVKPNPGNAEGGSDSGGSDSGDSDSGGFNSGGFNSGGSGSGNPPVSSSSSANSTINPVVKSDPILSINEEQNPSFGLSSPPNYLSDSVTNLLQSTTEAVHLLKNGGRPRYDAIKNVELWIPAC